MSKERVIVELHDDLTIKEFARYAMQLLPEQGVILYSPKDKDYDVAINVEHNKASVKYQCWKSKR